MRISFPRRVLLWKTCWEVEQMFEFIIIFHSTQLDINCIQIASLRLATMQDVGCTFVILLLFCYCIVRIKSKQASKLVGGDIHPRHIRKSHFRFDSWEKNGVSIRHIQQFVLHHSNLKSSAHFWRAGKKRSKLGWLRWSWEFLNFFQEFPDLSWNFVSYETGVRYFVR